MKKIDEEKIKKMAKENKKRAKETADEFKTFAF